MRNKDFELNLLIIFSWIDLLSRALRVLPVLRVLRVLRVLHCMCIPFRERLPLQPPLGILARRTPFFFLSIVQRKIGATKKKCAKNFINNFITFPYFEIITHCLDSHAPSVFLFSH